MSPIASRWYALLLLLFAGCSLRDIALEGRACPCPGSFECDPATNECVPIGTLDFTAVPEVFDFAHDSAPPPVDELVASITATGTTLSPVFDPSVTKYTLPFPISVASTTMTVTLTPAAAALGGSVLIDGVSTSSSEVSLAGRVSFDVTVALDTESVTYAFALQRSDYFKPDETMPTAASSGSSVALSSGTDGERLFVGAPNDQSTASGVNGDPDMVMSNAYIGAVWVYERPTGGSWAKTAYLKPAVVDDDTYYMNFGSALAADGDLLAVGVPHESSSTSGVNSTPSYGSEIYSGAVYIFARQGGVWSQTAYIKSATGAAHASFGTSVALSNGTLVVGAQCDSSAATGLNGDQTDTSEQCSGAAFVFRMGATPSDWTQTGYLKASNTREAALFGSAVAIDSGFIAVGAVGEDSASTGVNGDQVTQNGQLESGAVYVFDNPPTTQLAFIKPGALLFAENFGASIALSGSTLVVGSAGESSASNMIDGNEQDTSAEDAGAAWVYVDLGGTWSQQAYLKAPNAAANFSFGWSVAIVGDDVLVGSLYESSSSVAVDGLLTPAVAAGAAYLFSRSGTAWTFAHHLKASYPQAGDQFGASVALSADTVAVGAPAETGASTGIDGDPTLRSIDKVGAAYAFPR